MVDPAQAGTAPAATQLLKAHAMSYQTVNGRKVRFAIVGCGDEADRHFDAIAAHKDGCELVDVCDFSTDLLRRAEQRTGLVGHPTLNGLLRATKADCVVLTSPSDLHAPVITQIAGTGRHVAIEGPLASNWKDGRAVLEACDAAGVRLFVVDRIAPDAALVSLKQAIDARRLGSIYAVAVDTFDIVRDDAAASAATASPRIDLMEWLIGPVESVVAYNCALPAGEEGLSSKAVALKWRSGALGTINVSCGIFPHRLPATITVLGENGTARLVAGDNGFKLAHWDTADKQPLDLAGDAKNTSLSHHAFYDNMIATLHGEAEPNYPARESLRSLELATALYLSTRDGKRVMLPLLP